MMHVAACGPLMYSLGCILQYNYVAENDKSLVTISLNWMGLALSILFLIFRQNLKDIKWVKNRLTPYKLSKRKYYKAKLYMGIDYDIANPILGDNCDINSIRSPNNS